MIYLPILCKLDCYSLFIYIYAWKKHTHANCGYLATNPFEAPPPNAAMNCWHGQLGLMYNLEAWKIKKKEQKVNSINTKSRWTIVFLQMDEAHQHKPQIQEELPLFLGQFQSMNQEQWVDAVQTFLKYKAATRWC